MSIWQVMGACVALWSCACRGPVFTFANHRRGCNGQLKCRWSSHVVVKLRPDGHVVESHIRKLNEDNQSTAGGDICHAVWAVDIVLKPLSVLSDTAVTYTARSIKKPFQPCIFYRNRLATRRLTVCRVKHLRVGTETLDSF